VNNDIAHTALTQGAEANSSGKRLERAIQDEFCRRGVPVFPFSINKGNRDLLAFRYAVQQVPYSKPWERPPWMSGKPRRSFVDLVFYGPQNPDGVGMEFKAQDESGSVDLKLPTVVNSLFPQMPWPELWLVCDGDGIPAGLVNWLRDQATRHRTKKISVLSASEARRAIKELCGR
jgi:hypothetical protein